MRFPLASVAARRLTAGGIFSTVSAGRSRHLAVDPRQHLIRARRRRGLACTHGQLQHGGALAPTEQRRQDMPSVGQFERVVVAVRYARVDLSEAGDPAAGPLFPEQFCS